MVSFISFVQQNLFFQQLYLKANSRIILIILLSTSK